jgi:hypothetical protein
MFSNPASFVNGPKPAPIWWAALVFVFNDAPCPPFTSHGASIGGSLAPGPIAPIAAAPSACARAVCVDSS